MKQRREQEERGHLLAGTTSRAAPAMITKGCATFWVGEEDEAPRRRRFAVPVTLLGHPRSLELLGEARE
jgi:SAUR family protein